MTYGAMKWRDEGTDSGLMAWVLSHHGKVGKQMKDWVWSQKDRQLGVRYKIKNKGPITKQGTLWET